MLFLRDYGIRPTVYSSGHDFLGKTFALKALCDFSWTIFEPNIPRNHKTITTVASVMVIYCRSLSKGPHYEYQHAKNERNGSEHE